MREKKKVCIWRSVENNEKKVAEENLKRVYKKRLEGEEDEEESPWMNKDIKREINVRKAMNREVRNTGGTNKARVMERYEEQKELV